MNERLFRAASGLPQYGPKPGDTIAVWFSCGAASAVAAMLTIRLYGHYCNIRIINNPVIEENWDNRRFLHDVEKWLGVQIEIATHKSFPFASASEVWERRKYMAGIDGAPCTSLLKKGARQQWEQENSVEWHVLGFHAGERKRHEKFVALERSNVLPVLIECGFTKELCAREIFFAGIELPLAYKLGLPNANCIGCVKATSPTYWNKIREVAPDVFEARAQQSRRLGVRLVRVNNERIFLDELSPDAVGRPLEELKMPDCTIFCEE